LDRDNLLKSIDLFPKSPGVYLMKDAENRYLYIGKAINLRNRVRSYYLDKHEDRYQIPYLLKKVTAIDWIATNSETEALILEANLIKSHKPAYNADLKDDKHYPYLKVTIKEPFPQLLVVRKILNDGAKYFGPYTDAGAMRRNMDFAKKIFKIRNCKRKLPLKNPGRPCINYAMKNCSGPCVGKITKEDYAQNVSMLIQFLKCQRKDIITFLEKHMKHASGNLDYETAASIRDQIALIHKASNIQRVDLKTPRIDFDVFGISKTKLNVCLCILSFKQGLLLSKRHFFFKNIVWSTSVADHEAVILQFYQNTVADLPNEIILPSHEGFDRELLESWFAKQYKKKLTITVPERGRKKELIKLAQKNASLYIAQKAPAIAEATLNEFMKILNLPRLPETIEAFDISNMGDKFCVAGMVHFRHGIAYKSHYRRFKIKTVSGQNDFAMMMEAVTRRLERLKKESKDFPDLLLIDGGPGQLSSAMKPLSAYRDPPMIISIAKKEETLYSPYMKKQVKLPENHPVRKLIEKIRNESHRYAISYHKKIRGKQFRSSSLENVPGIGKIKAQALLRRFGSITRIRKASAEEIAGVNGFSKNSAQKFLKQIKKTG
jgi:excinuclease ABC subunit C